tara:strand:- start:253 stop:504 length:252 start_codon:yes stop_codon:yes gene_type:complete
MLERTNTEIAEIFAAAGDSVTLIGGTAQEWETDAEWKERVQRNVEHLEIIKGYTKIDGTTSIWTTEDFTAIDKAIVDGKKIYS